MAKNSTDGQRKGAVKNRTQFFNADLQRWVKRDTRTGQIISVKADDQPYKGIRREKRS